MKKLLEVQRELKAVVKNAANPFFKSKYADLSEVLSVVKPLLNKNDIILLQPHETNEFGDFVKTVLIDATTGKEIVSSMTKILCSSNKPQDLGSAITYARRYGIKSLLALEDEDDDAEKATGREKTKASKSGNRFL